MAVCKRCVTGGPLWVCLACWAGVAHVYKDLVDTNKPKADPVRHPVLAALGEVDFEHVQMTDTDGSSSTAVGMGGETSAIGPSTTGACFQWENGCPICYRLSLPEPDQALAQAARVAPVNILFQTRLRGAIDALNDYGEEGPRQVSPSLEHAAPLSLLFYSLTAHASHPTAATRRSRSGSTCLRTCSQRSRSGPVSAGSARACSGCSGRGCRRLHAIHGSTACC